MATALRNPYEVLGVEKTASPDDIRSAYRKLALKYHPDRNSGDKAAEERFKEISEAYATLRDPEARERFDRYGATNPSAARPDFGTVDWQTVFNEADINVTFDGSQGFPKTGHPLFDTLFGVMTGVMRNQGLLPGETHQVSANVNPELARAGGTMRVRVPGPSVCSLCHGSGREAAQLCPRCKGQGVLRQGDRVEVAIPAGVKPGTKLRLKGLGGPGNPPGDVFVSVGVTLPPEVEYDAGVLRTHVSLTPLEAKQGKTVEVLGLEVCVPPGTPDAHVIRRIGDGVGGGDLEITVRHSVWRGLLRGLREGLGFA